MDIRGPSKSYRSNSGNYRVKLSTGGIPVPQCNDPYDDRFANAFLPPGDTLAVKAAETESLDRTAAIKLYKRGNAVYRITRFPFIGTELNLNVFETQRKTYLRGSAIWSVSIQEVLIPHVYAGDGDGDGDGSKIPTYVRMPTGVKTSAAVLLITGLDGHLPDNSERTDPHLQRGWVTMIVDIPGTASCPANKRDPLSPDRMFSSIFHWIEQHPVIDQTRVIAWGLSAGGYYAIRLAHTHAVKLLCAVGHGAGIHHYIGKEWLAEANHHEYPFDLPRAYLGKYGYENFGGAA